MKTDERIVYPAHGHERAMGYRYRARIEKQVRVTWFGFGKKITEYRYVIERHYMAWKDDEKGYWKSFERIARAEATCRLDEIEAEPKGEYILEEKG